MHNLIRCLAPLLLIPLVQPAQGQNLPALRNHPALSTAAGPANAPVTAIVFSDFACPYSAQFSYVLSKLERRYPAQLRVVFRQSPLSIHPGAPLAHRAALAAAAQGRFAEMSDLLYGNQTHQDIGSLYAYARQLHLDLPRFRHDMDSSAIAARLAADMEEARGFNVQSTPTVYINGKALVGFQTEEILASTIDAAMSRRVPGLPAASEAPQPRVAEEIATQLLASPAPERGKAGAPLTIVEFTDFQCPFCRSAVEPLQNLLAERGKEVRLIFRAFPLDFHPEAQLAAEAAYAAGAQGKFWQMHNLMFAHQSALKEADLMTYAAEAGLNVERFRSDLQTHAFAGQVAADRALGSRAGVTGTPTFFVDGQPIIGVRSLPELRQLADAHRHSSGGQQAAVVKPVAVPDRIVSGSENAPLTITWYTDVRSSSASRQAELIQSLTDKFDKRMKVLYRPFPLDAYPDASLASRALLAAQAQNAFWPMFQKLAHHESPLDDTAVLQIALSLGMDGPAFNKAFREAQGEVDSFRTDAERRGVRGAPVLYINAHRIDGLQALDQYLTLAEKELSQVPVAALSQSNQERSGLTRSFQ